jgi:hypothetical protein
MRAAIEAQISPSEIAALWRPAAEQFRRERAEFLLY